MFASQTIIGTNTMWNGFPMITEEFWLSDSASALAEFLLYRSFLYNYAATEIRSAAKLGSPTLQAEILSTLLGSSRIETGETVSNPTVFDLFDFADLDIGHQLPEPKLALLDGVDLGVCAKPQADDSLVLYDVAEVDELVQLRKEELMNGQLRPQDEEFFLVEAAELRLLVQSTNYSRQISYNRYLALRSWTELITTMVSCSEIDGGRRPTFILHSIQLILPKLETAVEDDLPEAIELARLAETLISKLESTTSKAQSTRSGDIIDEKLHQLFQTCVRGITLATCNVHLRETYYNICSHYISRITFPDRAHESMRRHSQQVIKTAGLALIETTCDDAYAGQETCRVSALLLLNLLAALDKNTDSILAESISQSNYLGLFLDAIRALPMELRNAEASGMLS